MAAMTALLIGLAAGPCVIRRLAALKIGQPVRGYGMETHLAKSGTPTMGGVLVLFAIACRTLLWFDLSNRFVWIVLWVTLGFGAIGWVDDWRKVVHKDPEGMRSREKYFWQSVIGLVAALLPGVQHFGELQLARAASCSTPGCARASTSTCRPRPACCCPSSRRSAIRWACSAS